MILVEVYFVYLFVFLFVVGGITGLYVGNAGLDILFHDTYFVVAHFHYILSLAALMVIISGVIHFVPR